MKKKDLSLEERKAEVLIKLRKYKLIEKEEGEEVRYIIKTPKDKKRVVILCIPDETTVGIAYVNKLEKEMEKKEFDNGIIITSGRYTHTARKKSVNKNIELLPRIFPAFNLFKHTLVPKHEILNSKDREQLLSKLKIEPYQLPQIKATDPAVKAIGAKPSYILKITRNSPTAGIHIAYRYVV